MNILKNFRNPWEAATEVLKTSVLDSKVLETKVLETGVLEGGALGDILTDFITDNEVDNDLNPYRGYCFDDTGRVIARFKIPTNEKSGGIFFINRQDLQKFKGDKKKEKSAYFDFLKKNAAVPTSKKMKEPLSPNRQDESRNILRLISKIYTQILRDFDFELQNLLNSEISVYAGYNDYLKYNNPHPDIRGINIVHDENSGTFRLTIGIDRLDELLNVANSVNILGAHELEGHGIKKWGDETATHYKVYEWQMDHISWQYMDDKSKDGLVVLYIDYLKIELKSKGNLKLFNEKLNEIERNYDAQIFRQTAIAITDARKNN